MFELFGLFVAFLLIAGVIVGLATVIGILKLGFEIALLPVTLAIGAVKVVLALVVCALFLAVGLPLLIVCCVLFLPLLVLGAVVCGGAALVGCCF